MDFINYENKKIQVISKMNKIKWRAVFFGLSTMKGNILSIFLTIFCFICHCYPLKVLKLNIFSSNIMQRVLNFVLPHIIVEHR